MFGIGLPEVAVLLLVLVGLVWLFVRSLARVVDAPPPREAAVASDWQRVMTARTVGLAAGAGLGVVTWQVGALGRGPMLALAVFGLCVLIGTAVGETSARPTPSSGVRTASLTARRVRDFLPWTTWLVAPLTVVLVAVLVLTTLTASDDDLGRARAVGCSNARVGTLQTPYPGAFYSVPLAVVLLVVLVTAALAARQVVLRPRGLAADEQGEDRLRRNSLDVVVAATGVAVAAPLCGVSVVAAAALSNVASDPAACAPGWYEPVGAVLFAVGLLALLSTSLLLGRLAFVRGPAQG